jgi:hypothetical protein
MGHALDPLHDAVRDVGNNLNGCSKGGWGGVKLVQIGELYVESDNVLSVGGQMGRPIDPLHDAVRHVGNNLRLV